jgi:hypothetical protein
MDYQIAAALSEVYGGQDSYTRVVDQMVSGIFTSDTFRPTSGRESLQVIRWLLVELEGRERFVRDLYRRHLPQLQNETRGSSHVSGTIATSTRRPQVL